MSVKTIRLLLLKETAISNWIIKVSTGNSNSIKSPEATGSEAIKSVLMTYISIYRITTLANIWPR